jgi:uncharacterized membrane protein
VGAQELLDLIFRWAHLIAGIMWIGNSMLFNWLDRNLEKSAELSRLSQGKIYMVHSGAFYDVEKKLLEPGGMPKNLHWFKWQNFTTWATGIGLLVTVYYMHGASFLVDPRVANISPTVAITLSLASLITAWIVYDGLWKIYGEHNPRMATIISIALLFGSVIGFSQVFGGRGAYIQVGVMIGTLMTGNVWFTIVPSQHSLVDATKSGKEQDATLSIRAKQRSIHNNYFTFPLLFIMISQHFPNTHHSHLNWLILILIMVGGAGVRHFMNIRYLGEGRVRPTGAFLAPAALTAALTIAGVIVASQFKATTKVADYPVDYPKVADIMAKRCAPCHSTHPTDDVYKVAPLGIMFDRPAEVKRYASRIHARAVESDQMPLNNKTGMTEQERAELGRWIEDGAIVR